MTEEVNKAAGVYHTKCFNKDGELVWEDVSYNVCTITGRNAMLDTFFAGSSYTGSWYMSLYTGATNATTASTYASPTVTEVTSSVVAARLPVTWTASSGASKSATSTSFSIIGSATISGNMLVSGGTGVATVGNTSATNGILFSSAPFAGGSKVVNNGDSLSVTYSCSV